jgi:hypothetical protein
LEVSSQFHVPATLFPGNEVLIPNRWEAGLAPELVLILRGKDKSLAPIEFEFEFIYVP